MFEYSTICFLIKFFLTRICNFFYTCKGHKKSYISKKREKIMKKFLLVPLLVLSLGISLILIKCTDHTVMPTENKSMQKPLLKENISKLDLTKDTIITLPTSGITILVEKSFPSDKLKERDKWLSKNKISSESLVTPNALDCNYYFVRYWALTNQYTPMPGKALGIWVDGVSWTDCYNVNCFRMISVDVSHIGAAQNAHFKDDSIMVRLSNNNYSGNITTINGTPNDMGYYFIDEPEEHGAFTSYQIFQTSNAVYNHNHNAKLLVSSYKWPSPVVCNLLTNYRPYYTESIQASNTYIMCDQYHGDCCGTTDDYWTKYRSYYGTNKCIMNWVHGLINNGAGGGYIACPSGGQSNSFNDLFGDANENSINKMWLYCLGITDKYTAIGQFVLLHGVMAG